MIDPLWFAVAAAILGPLVGGPLAVSALERLPARWRRPAEWVTIVGAGILAVLAGPGSRGRLVYLLAALPGFLTFLVWRSLLATTLVAGMPMYFVIAILNRGRATHVPEIALDRAIAVDPDWMIVYGSLYVFVLILPLLVVRQRDLIRRAMQAYLFVMLVSYAGFLLYPTTASRVEDVASGDFSSWALQLVYSLDPPYNCFPSLHVAYSFVSALACYRVHRGVGAAASGWAVLIAISTLYTKQHYVVDVIVGAAAAGVAYVLFLRRHPRAAIDQADRDRAPSRALVAVAAFTVMVGGFWIAYRTGLP